MIRPFPFLDISSIVSFGNDVGVLSIVFHPQYGLNGRFFVQYVDLGGDTAITEFRRSTEDPLIADATFRRTLLTVDQPLDNVPTITEASSSSEKTGFSTRRSATAERT